MINPGMVFKRYEKKYLLTKEQYENFRKAVEQYMQEDSYGKSTICNIYYDTCNYELIRASIEKPAYKEKLRLRSYGVPKRQSPVFLEIKKKYHGVVYKRRISLPLEEACRGIAQREINGIEGQIVNEINYFLQHYELQPVIFLAYDRIAMYGKEDEELRITFDFSIRSRRRELDLSAGDHGKLLLPDGSVVMEIKVRDTYPFWLVQALEEFEIYPASFSKYGKVFEEDILSGEIEKHHGSSVPRTALSRASGEYHPKKRRGFELPQNETRLRAGRIWKRRNPKYKKIP